MELKTYKELFTYGSIITIMVISVLLITNLNTVDSDILKYNIKIKLDFDTSLFEIYEVCDFGQTVWGLTSADFNMDNKIDFAVSYSNAPFTYSGISIFYNDGNLGFIRDDVFSFNYSYITDLDSGDYDNDGDIDLIFGYSEWMLYNNLRYYVYGIVNILFNDGINNFIDEILVTKRGSGNPNDSDSRINPKISSGDYDLDGDIDLLIGDNSGKVEFYLNNGKGNFTSTGVIYDWGNKSWGIASTDLDDDGDIDIIIAAEKNCSNGCIYFKYNNKIPSNLSTCFKTGYGDIFTTFIANPATGCIASLDYDNDGDIDFIFGNSDNISIFINDIGKYYPIFICQFPISPEGYIDNIAKGALTSADYDNDGYCDFISGGVQGIVRLFINNYS